MSATVVALPIAITHVLPMIISIGVALASNMQENSEEDTQVFQGCEDRLIIPECKMLEKSFETNFMDKDILLKTLQEHGMQNIKEDSFGISAEIDEYLLKFEKFETNQPYQVKISYLPSSNAEEKVQDLVNEYTSNVQEESYLSIVEKLKENNLEIENEEVLEDNSIVLTINLE